MFYDVSIINILILCEITTLRQSKNSDAVKRMYIHKFIAGAVLQFPLCRYSIFNPKQLREEKNIFIAVL